MHSSHRLATFLIALALALTCRDVSAHPELRDRIEIFRGENGIELVLTTSMATVMATLGRKPLRGAFYAPPELEAAITDHVPYLERHLEVRLDDRETAVRVRDARLETQVTEPVARRVDLERVFARVHLVTNGPRAPATLSLRSTMLTDVVPDDDGQSWIVSYVVVVRDAAGRNVETRALAPDDRLTLQLTGAPSTRAELGSFFVLGVRHIAVGLDHLLFLAALVLGASTWRGLALRIVAFTLAHTIALALGATGVVSASPRIVEPLVAASIIVAALTARSSRRDTVIAMAVAFGFGLVHGLAFASGLRASLGGAASIGLALVGFTLGVEVVQQGLALPLFVGARSLARTERRSVWLDRVRTAIALLGLLLLIQTLRSA